MFRQMILSTPRRALALAALGCALAPAGAWAAPSQCPLTVLLQPKNNTLYLYFPTGSDATFPEYKAGEVDPTGTSPLAPFSVSDLDPGVGTTAELRKSVKNQVADDYCEFDVNVIATTSKPNPAEARWQVVGIGSDAATVDDSAVYGVAQKNDLGDVIAKDYTRVFAGTFQVQLGFPGAALEGPYSTLERWTNAIAGVISHESGHNYGAEHKHAEPRPFSVEDDVSWHLMATYPDITGVIRAERNRHFSDTTYEVLGHNIGLSTQMLHNWDFVNPNASPADRLRLTVLSTAANLSLNDWYDGMSSPWGEPTVTAAGTMQSFHGVTYSVHYLDFATPKSWLGGSPGEVPAGGEFHVGATFANPEPVIVFDVDLLSGDALLKLAPRIPGYNPGSMDMAEGKYKIDLFNPDPEAGEMVLTDVQVYRAPRMIDLAAMMRETRPVDTQGLPVDFHSRASFANLTLRDTLALPVGRLTDPRTVDLVARPEDCRPQGPPDLQDCPEGYSLSLFPATYTYVVATVVEPNALHWDRERNAYVTGPLRTAVYFQVAGQMPDFNGNGVDDLIDIRTGTSRDDDRNGVPDEAWRGEK